MWCLDRWGNLASSNDDPSRGASEDGESAHRDWDIVPDQRDTFSATTINRPLTVNTTRWSDWRTHFGRIPNTGVAAWMSYANCTTKTITIYVFTVKSKQRYLCSSYNTNKFFGQILIVVLESSINPIILTLTFLFPRSLRKLTWLFFVILKGPILPNGSHPPLSL